MSPLNQIFKMEFADLAASQCASQSIGPANQLFALLIQTIISAKCAISPPDMWPQDYAAQAFANGENTNL